MDPQSTGMLVLTSMLLSTVTLFVVVREAHGTLSLGRIVTRVRPGRQRRWLAVAAMAAVVGATAVGDLGVEVSLAFSVLSAAAVMLLFTSGLRDTVFAEHGVRSGWFVRRFKDLEEWRLTGDHLRWKLFGEWQACEVPLAQQADLRARLEQLIPDRESRFRS